MLTCYHYTTVLSCTNFAKPAGLEPATHKLTSEVNDNCPFNERKSYD